MRKLNKEKQTNNSHIVKANKKAIVISILLAITGVVGAVYFYTYTHAAKMEQQYYQTKSELNSKLEVLENTKTQLESTTQTKEELNKQLEELNKQKQDLEQQLQAKQAEKARVASIQAAQAASVPKVVQSTTPVQTTVTTAVSGSKYDWLSQAGVPQSDWQYADYIISKESGWNPNAVNKSSGACGLGQQLPCGKWAGDWNDPIAAIKAQYGYVKARYGGYAGAYQFWLANKWY